MDSLTTPPYFDPFAMSPAMTDSTFVPDFSSVSLFEPFADDFSADLTSDSAGSPASPISPVLSSSSYAAPATTGDFGSWDNIDHSPEPDGYFKTFPAQFLGRALTPAVNPMDLTLQPAVASYPSELQGPDVQALPPFQSPLPISPVSPVSPTTAVVPPQLERSSKRHSMAGRKRKSSTSTSEQDQASPKRASTSPSPAAQHDFQAPQKKTAHNMIEKRYRTNLNDKIAQLREAIPSLRASSARLGSGSYEDGEDGLDEDFTSLVPVPKLNKATILSKATEYILQLEQRNRNLETENNAIRGRMEGLEMLMLSRASRSNTAGWS